MKGYVFQGPGASSWEDVPDPVVEAGPDARTVRPGDRVLVSCTTARSRCLHCRKAMYGQCRGGGGWTLGRLIDGTQAEYVRVPFADLSVHPLPEALADQDAVLLADIFPAGGHGGGVRRLRPGRTDRRAQGGAGRATAQGPGRPHGLTAGK